MEKLRNIFLILLFCLLGPASIYSQLYYAGANSTNSYSVFISNLPEDETIHFSPIVTKQLSFLLQVPETGLSGIRVNNLHIEAGQGVSVGEIKRWRDIYVQEIEIFPGKLSDLTEEEQFEVKFTYSPFPDKQVISSSFDPLYREFVDNYPAVNDMEYSFPHLLIITHDMFFENLQPFVEWKDRKGFKTTVVRLSEINQRPTATEIKKVISDSYARYRTDHVLLVGHPFLLPFMPGVSGTGNDHEYVTLSAESFLPGMMIGRFSVSTPEQCDIYVSNVLTYEKASYSSFNSWQHKATVVAGIDNLDDQHAREMIHSFRNAGFQTVDDLRQQIRANSLENFTHAVNQGRSWIFYIGHGNAAGWHNIAPGFNLPDIDNLEQNHQLPVVISVGCGTAAIGRGQESFGEKWMYSGKGKGAIAFIGASDILLYYYSDTLGKQTTLSYLSGKTNTTGAALTFGKVAMYRAFPENERNFTRLTMQQHLLLGDPTLAPWTTVPRHFRIEKKIADNTLILSVYTGNTPVENALVTVSNADFSRYERKFTGENGLVSFQAGDLKNQDSLQFVVTHRDFVPAQVDFSLE